VVFLVFSHFGENSVHEFEFFAIGEIEQIFVYSTLHGGDQFPADLDSAREAENFAGRITIYTVIPDFLHEGSPAPVSMCHRIMRAVPHVV
jgi:hypothetical protein